MIDPAPARDFNRDSKPPTLSASPSPRAILAEMRSALREALAQPVTPICGPCLALRRHLLTEAQWRKVECEHVQEPDQ